MKILISGSSGLIGKAIADSLQKEDHKIIRLFRKNYSTITPNWDIEKKIINLGNEQEIDVVINLAGESIAQGRWTKEKKDRIKNSRVNGTKLISDFFAKSPFTPKLIISGSAVGIYGSRGDETLDEESPPGTGFLSEVCQQWEKMTSSAADKGIRVVNVRFGMVLSSTGGALSKMLFPFKLGLGGVIGNGKQYVSWVSIYDVVEAIKFIINNHTIHGPVNIVSPSPVTNFDFTKILGKTLHRPTIFPMPAFLTKMIFGEMGKELLLASTNVMPTKLLQSGYEFKHPTLGEALNALLTISKRPE